jgi:signal transduction histidine kinase/DNA-binding response OmpR family regulator
MNMKSSADGVEILIAEDSPTQAEQLHYILTQHGYRLTVVRNGREALTAIARRRPTLVISDVIMPQMTGYELCSHIKRDPALRRVPVILLTSLTDPADVVKGLESGADSFIFKPYDEQYLLTRISYTLANQHLRESETAQMGVEIVFAGRKFFITSDRLQILNLLLSTYEAAVHKNKELAAAQDELRHLNEHLESRIKERTVALEAQLGRLDLLYRITRAIGERQDLQSIFQVMIRRLEDDLPVDLGCVCLYRPQTATLDVMTTGVNSRKVATALGLTRDEAIPVDAGLARCVQGELVYEPDTAVTQFQFAQRLARSSLRSLVVAPLLAENKVFGVLIAARRQVDGFSGAECEFLRQLSEHVALAAHQSQLHANLQQAYDDLRQSQQSAMQQERLRALGQMASGVAHDINNAISPVALYTESLLEQEANLSARARKYLGTIQRAIEDVAQTVRRMREFYRPNEPQQELTHIDLNQLIEQVLDLTRVRWRDEPQRHGLVIHVQTELAPDLPKVKGAESDVRDALTNLVFNAVDAMPAGGRLTLRTRAIHSVLDGKAQDEEEESAGVVRLEVSDTGIGMDTETKRRCLEPFFTTKGERGTGLGLAMIYGMAQRHSADMEIDSEPGKGTTMRIEFPIPTVAKAPTVRVRALQMPSPLRILLVDDDPLIIESMRNTLESDGHTVIAADGGQAGIDAMADALARNEPFAAVITDLGMPYVDGRRVAAAVKATSTSTPVILLTGWGQRLIDDNDIPPYVDRVLNKPPKLADLRRVLSEVANLKPGAPEPQSRSGT